ncbi:hypothetical protein BROOK1789B_1824 [Bathymodiolus brooksi thiotrophic gill symbiont]|nr:hypothetical protein BROOK1789B_1824 [Bathymodiolus brooksi thiotrophic gill symbiont]
MTWHQLTSTFWKDIPVISPLFSAKFWTVPLPIAKQAFCPPIL